MLVDMHAISKTLLPARNHTIHLAGSICSAYIRTHICLRVLSSVCVYAGAVGQMQTHHSMEIDNLFSNLASGR